MKNPIKPLPDRIALMRDRKATLLAKLARLEAKAKTEDRKLDTRRKIVVGAAVLSEMERTPQFRAFVLEMLDRDVSREQDRAVIADLIQSVNRLPAPAGYSVNVKPKPVGPQAAPSEAGAA